MLNLEILAADLDFAIGETGKPLVGVSPAAIAGLTYNGPPSRTVTRSNLRGETSSSTPRS